MLALYEKLLLLTIHEDKGTLIQSTVDRMKLGMVGALLADLTLFGKIQAKENHRLAVINSDPVGDADLDEVFEIIKASEKERRVGYWIEAINPKHDKMRKQILERFVKKGFVTQEEDHLVWVIPTPFQPEVNGSSKFWLVEHLRGIILARESGNSSDLALLSLLRACNLLDLVFLKDERRLASRSINELVVTLAIKDPLIQTIQEIENSIAVIAEDE